MTFAGYASRLFLGRVLWFLIGFSGLMLMLDLLDRAKDVLARDGGGLPAILTYLTLRLPAIANQLLPLAVLMAALAAEIRSVIWPT